VSDEQVSDEQVRDEQVRDEQVCEFSLPLNLLFQVLRWLLGPLALPVMKVMEVTNTEG
jgi:hypothetical protein